MDINGAVCIVTGASSGIGAATARLLRGMGARVVLAARRAERLEALAAELPGSLALPIDVTIPGQVERLVTQTVDAHGRVDVLVNNAGQGLHVPLEELNPADLRAVFELNVVALLVGMQAVLPVMRARSGGAIINVSSATSLRVFPGLGGYAATKATLNMLSQVGRLELAGAGVMVSVVYPSVTATEFHDRLRAGHLVSGARAIPPDPPELAAAAIAFAIRSGEAHVLVADPPRPIAPWDSEGWSALLARQAPRAAEPQALRDDDPAPSAPATEEGHPR
ncbi:MAG TPA: SDR family oxidoreductase [Coriobacteriia bacterium]|nr:SDR family oxidoreductase [Coriobacteriia bacterium]